MYRYSYKYLAPLGELYLTSDGKALTSLSFKPLVGLKYVQNGQKLPIFAEASRWLDSYFSGQVPDFTPQFRRPNETQFRAEVGAELLRIPFGTVTTYGELAKVIAKKHGIAKMSAQAVGNAIGWNPVSLIVPCHRVIGKNYQLTGYGGGIDIKRKLLTLEGHRVEGMNIVL